MISIRCDGQALEVAVHHEVLCIEPWGPDSIRVRAGQHQIVEDLPGALIDPKPSERHISVDGSTGRVSNGVLTAVVEVYSGHAGLDAHVRFERTDTGEELVAEQRAHFGSPSARLCRSEGDEYGRLDQRFRSYADERIYGLGQRGHGRLNEKGLVLDLEQRDAEVGVPFLLSSRGYGFLWNMPAVGRVEFGENSTRWVADSARQIDYWVTAGDSPADLLAHYADTTGHPPALPEWDSGSGSARCGTGRRTS